MYKIKRFSLLNTTTGKITKGAKAMNKQLKNQARVNKLVSSNTDVFPAIRKEAENLSYKKFVNPKVNNGNTAARIRASRRYDFGN